MKRIGNRRVAFQALQELEQEARMAREAFENGGAASTAQRQMLNASRMTDAAYQALSPCILDELKSAKLHKELDEALRDCAAASAALRLAPEGHPGHSAMLRAVSNALMRKNVLVSLLEEEPETSV